MRGELEAAGESISAMPAMGEIRNIPQTSATSREPREPPESGRANSIAVLRQFTRRIIAFPATALRDYQSSNSRSMM